jgi:hypothetical protein
MMRPTFTIRDALTGIGRGSFAAVNGAVERLVGMGIVQPTGPVARERLFTVPAVISLFESAPGGFP